MVPFRGTFDHTLDSKNRLTVPARYRATLADGVVLAMPVDLKPCVGVWRPEEYERYSQRALAELPPLSPRLNELERFFYGSSQDSELDSAGRIMIPNRLGEHAGLQREVVVVGAGDHLELSDGVVGTSINRRCWAASRRSLRVSTTLIEMRRSRRRQARGRPAGLPPRELERSEGGVQQRRGHVPVLAAELLGLLDPQPGQIAVDCTFGDGGHARLIAERLGPSGTLVAVDRDPLAEERFAELATKTACSVRFIRAGYAEALELLTGEGLRADIVYFDLGMSSMQVDARERGFSYSYDAPLDMRMDPGSGLSAKDIVAEWDERRLARALRDFGEERRSGAIARAIVRRRERAPIETTLQLVDTINSAMPAPARFAGGHPAKRSFQALRIAVNDELGQLDRALPLAWELLREGGVLAAIAFHSLEDRRVKHFLGERARGCVCPPELPVCVCGHRPEAALIARRAIVPSAPEVAANPRAASARLRAARKLAQESLA